MARQLRKGTFLAYVGQYPYLVDAFSTSTDWEYDLFQTDDALELDDPYARPFEDVDIRGLDIAWPTDTAVDGWLSTDKELA
jgi:hypothetical protein